ncbi:MAG TPA: ABC transporter ATP-binding protein [Sulfurimonas sp.]|nr:ABC transporter ATP-binding protein [Sulfurimonas sp.]
MIVSQLSLSYHDNKILENVNFELKSHLSILGSNGSGKSTLAKALCGLIEYKGSIKLQGEELSKISSKQRAKLISYIPSKMQSFEQFTTVQDFVLLGRYPYKPSFKDYGIEDKNLVSQILHELNITHLARHTLHELSSGQQQLTLIAQALAQQSKILIFDEPTANLDPKNTSLFVKELQKLRQKYTTILITHDIQLASFFNDPVLFIQDKKVRLFEEDFFNTQNLSQAYGINFKNENGMIGISYA